MAASEIADDEVLLRRFDPSRPENFVVDEAGLPARLRQSALVFDVSDDAYECSVYQESKLAGLTLERTDCLEAERPGWMVAEATAGQVRTVKRATVPAAENPFRVVEDEYPHGTVDTHARDGAHALIAHDKSIKGRDKWYTLIAAEFTI